jgi:release factor glutamine methyltransferase
LTLLHLLTITRNYFSEKGIESARLDAELLLGHCLGLDRVGLYLEHDRPLQEQEVQAYRELVRRRAAHEPVAYITGRRDFWTLTLEISRGVLIPRPETEVLVERALKFLAALDIAHPRVLDIGTGSGAIALALAAEMPNIAVTALDASVEAVTCARDNAERLGFSGRVRVEQAQFPDACPQDAGLYDLIVSNPPYIASGDIEGLAPDIREYEPRMALDGGVDGLDVYRRWVPHILPLLKKGGALMLEIGHDQGVAVSGLLAGFGHVSGIEVVRDYARLERVVMCCRV